MVAPHRIGCRVLLQYALRQLGGEEDVGGVGRVDELELGAARARVAEEGWVGGKRRGGLCKGLNVRFLSHNTTHRERPRGARWGRRTPGSGAARTE
jgi:hypothetical protein